MTVYERDLSPGLLNHALSHWHKMGKHIHLHPALDGRTPAEYTRGHQPKFPARPSLMH